MTKMKGTFQQSRDLKELVENHNWTLYDMSNPPEGRAHTWEEVDKMAPADKYEIGHNYLFVPIPKNGETLRQAYTQMNGLGPSLIIDDPNEDRWISLRVQRKVNGNVALFSRLFMEQDFAVASSPETMYIPNPDVVIMKYELLVDTFKRHFRIVSPAEYGSETPVPIPFVPEMN